MNSIVDILAAGLLFGAIVVCMGILGFVPFALGMNRRRPSFRRRLFSTLLLRQFHTLLTVGLPVHDIAVAGARRMNAGMRYDLERISEGLQSGLLLADALTQPALQRPVRLNKDALDKTLFGGARAALVQPAEAELLRVGEMTGQLKEALESVLDHRKRFGDLYMASMASFMYVASLCISLLGVASGILTFIIPKFVKMFTELDVSLPPLTLAVMQTANTVGRHVGWALPIALGSAIAGALLGRYGMLRRSLRRERQPVSSLLQRLVWVVPLPFMCGVMRRMALAEFCHELGLLLRARMPVPRALAALGDGTLNAGFRDRIRQAARQVEDGTRLDTALDRAGLNKQVGWFCCNLKGAADPGSGLIRMGESIVEGISFKSALMVHLLPAVLTMVIGLIVGVFVISMALPLWALITNMTGGY